MKKQYFLFFALIFSACLPPSGDTPQVTVTSEVTVTSTPIPTPTLHPAFIEIQEKIKSSGTRFTLQADGTVHAGSETIPGLTVAPDGIMTLTVNGETVTLDPADVDFDDETGITIDGYKWDATANNGAGVWVEAMSPSESQLYVDMEKWGIDLDGVGLDKYEIKDTIDGKKALVDRNTQKVIYYDGVWEDVYIGHFLVDHDMCKKTDWVGGAFGSETPPKGDLTDFSHRYTMPLREYAQRVGKDDKVIFGNRAYLYYLGGANNCWAEKFVPVMVNGERVENATIVYMMWKDESGLPQHVKTFKQRDLELIFAD